MKQSFSILALGLALVLTACGGSPTQEAASSPATESAAVQPEVAESASAGSGTALCNSPSCDPNSGTLPADGKYEFTYLTGATGTFGFDSKADPDVEALRKEAKAEPVHYMNVEVDNRKGTDHAPVYQVVAFDADGKKYTYVGIGDFFDKWRDGVDTDRPGMTDLYNRFVDASNAHMSSIAVSEVGTQLLAFEGELPKDGFTRVEVQPSGMGDGVDAYLEGQEPTASDQPDALDGSMTVDQCMDEYAAETAADEGRTVAEIMNDPDYRELCETLVGQ